MSLKHEPASEPLHIFCEVGAPLHTGAVPRRAHIQGSKTFASLNSRLESNKVTGLPVQAYWDCDNEV
jgi:hypothetical protein